MNSSAVHLGGCGTLHANRPHDIPARIEALALLAGVSREAVHSQASAALRIAIHLDRNEFGRRYLQSIAVVRRRNAVGPVQATLAISFDQGGQTPPFRSAAQRFREVVWPGAEAARHHPLPGLLYAELVSGHSVRHVLRTYDMPVEQMFIEDLKRWQKKASK